MGEKRLFIDESKCMACRGCQTSCKQWNGLPAEHTLNRGGYQNPPDMSASTWTVVKFREISEGGRDRWNFFKDQCRHCLEPSCFMASRIKGSITRDKSGAVIFTNLTAKENFQDIRGACPYNIPRLDKSNGRIRKCTLCNDRIGRGMEPACAKTCPSGAITFGEEKEIIQKARERLRVLKPDYPEAFLTDDEGVTVIHLLLEAKSKYGIGEKQV